LNRWLYLSTPATLDEPLGDFLVLEELEDIQAAASAAILDQGCEDLRQDPQGNPEAIATVTGLVRGVGRGQLIPGRMVDDLPEDGIEDEAFVDGGTAASSLDREVGLKDGAYELPLLSGEVEGRGNFRRGKHGEVIFE